MLRPLTTVSVQAHLWITRASGEEKSDPTGSLVKRYQKTCRLTFESHARVAKRKAIQREGVWWRDTKKVRLTFSTRGFAARFRACEFATRSPCSNVSLLAGYLSSGQSLSWFKIKRNLTSRVRPRRTMRQIAATGRLACTSAATRLLALIFIIFTCHTRRFVAATCRGNVSQRFVALCVSALRLPCFTSADSQLKCKWEESVMNLTSDIFTESFFGVRVDSNAMYTCLKGSWTKGR